ncbi:hypothetical protein H5410_059265, partial [Solanum commersonii]
MLWLLGSGPEMELLDNLKFSRCVKLKIEAGNEPLKLCFNVGFVLITSSTSPLNRLCWSDTEDSKGRLNTQDGMVPSHCISNSI